KARWRLQLSHLNPGFKVVLRASARVEDVPFSWTRWHHRLPPPTHAIADDRSAQRAAPATAPDPAQPPPERTHRRRRVRRRPTARTAVSTRTPPCRLLLGHGRGDRTARLPAPPAGGAGLLPARARRGRRRKPPCLRALAARRSPGLQPLRHPRAGR